MRSKLATAAQVVGVVGVVGGLAAWAWQAAVVAAGAFLLAVGVLAEPVGD
jgi:multisubunit Na+/H+ antiporter MnhG subunit